MGRFAKAVDCVPEPCAVLGTQLRPFCLGHHLLLDRLGIDPLSLQADEFLLTVFVCAYSYDETMAGMIAGEWNDRFEKWQAKAKKADKKDNGALGRFIEYLKAGYSEPPIWKRMPTAASMIEMSAPWELLLLNRLVMAGYSQSEVLNGYLPAMRYNYYTVLELNQAANILDAKNWKKVFYTQADDEKMSQSNG